MITTEKELFDEFDRYFLTEPKLSYARIFAKEQCSVEGWFKGELLYHLTFLRDSTQLTAWKREATVLQTKKADFVVSVNGRSVYLELKAFPLKEMANQFRSDLVYGIRSDVLKLSQIGQGFCLLFIYPTPTQEDWKSQLEKHNKKLIDDKHPEIIVEDVGTPIHDEQSPLYIARLKVSRRQQQGIASNELSL